MPKISIPKEALSAMPLVGFHGEITVIDNTDNALSALSRLSKEPIVGFDTETRPNFQKGRMHNVALVQISTLDTCYLFRINKTGFLPELKAFIENEAIAKVGLSLKDDFMMLHKISEFTPAGFIDLQTYVKKFGIIDCSLQKIYGILFGQRISKGQRLSNWEAAELSESQQHYAAIDAWACLRIHRALDQGTFCPESSPYILTEESNPEAATL